MCNYFARVYEVSLSQYYYHRAKREERIRATNIALCRAVATASLLGVPLQGMKALIRNLTRLVNFALLIAIISFANEILLVLYFIQYYSFKKYSFT